MTENQLSKAIEISEKIARFKYAEEAAVSLIVNISVRMSVSVQGTTLIKEFVDVEVLLTLYLARLRKEIASLEKLFQEMPMTEEGV
jgi:hypothetical protein